MRDSYKILLICAGGMSTGLLMKKMEKYAVENGASIKITATGLGGYERHAPEYDVILVGPQVRFKLDEIKSKVSNPVSVMVPLDYGMQNCENIFKMADELYQQL